MRPSSYMNPGADHADLVVNQQPVVDEAIDLTIEIGAGS